MLFDEVGEHGRIGHAPRAFVAAGQQTAVRIKDDDAALAQNGQIRLHRRMLEHRGVHRRRDDDRAAVGDGIRREGIVGQTDGELGQHVGGGRRDQKQIGPAGQLDVIDAAVSGVAPLFDDDAVAGDGSQR